MILDLKWRSFLPTYQIHIPMIISVKMSFLIEWAWLCLWNVQCKILMHDFLPASCRNSSIGSIFVYSLSTQSPKPVCVLLLWTWYCGLWVRLGEGSLLRSAGAAEFQGISEVWSIVALQWPAQLSHFSSPLPSELVIKGKCLMPWAQSAYTTQLPRAMPYYRVSSTFLFCWPPEWLMTPEYSTHHFNAHRDEGLESHFCQRKKFLLSNSLIFLQKIYCINVL